MKVQCIRVEMDVNVKIFVFAFVMVSGEEGCSMAGEIRMASEKRDAYIVGETYECYLK